MGRIILTAEPKAPPIARAEKPSPVAVDKNAWGAVNWTSATIRVKGPHCPRPASTLNPICALSMLGVITA